MPPRFEKFWIERLRFSCRFPILGQSPMLEDAFDLGDELRVFFSEFGVGLGCFEELQKLLANEVIKGLLPPLAAFNVAGRFALLDPDFAEFHFQSLGCSSCGMFRLTCRGLQMNSLVAVIPDFARIIRPRNKTQLTVSAEPTPTALQRPRTRRQAMCHCRLAPAGCRTPSLTWLPGGPSMLRQRRDEQPRGDGRTPGRVLVAVQRSQVMADRLAQPDARAGEHRMPQLPGVLLALFGLDRCATTAFACCDDCRGEYVRTRSQLSGI